MNVLKCENNIINNNNKENKDERNLFQRQLVNTNNNSNGNISSNNNNCNGRSSLSAVQFRLLLEDTNGFDLFRKFLIEKNSLEYLELWNILKGFKEHYKNDTIESKSTASKVVYKKLHKTLETMNPKLIKLKDKTRKTIIYNIKHFSMNKDFRLENIFDEAKNELEQGLHEIFFNSFKSTDSYQRYIANYNNNNNNNINSNFTISNNNNNNENNDFTMPISSSIVACSSSNTHEITIQQQQQNKDEAIGNAFNANCSSFFATNMSLIKISELSATEKNVSNSHRLMSKNDFEGTLPAKPDNDNRNFLKFVEKLNRVKKEKDAEDASFTLKRLGRLNGEKFSALPPQLVLDAMKDKLTDQSDQNDADELILDEHLCRVWSPDSSPVNRSRSEQVKSYSNNNNNTNNNPPYLSRDEYIADGYTSSGFSESNLTFQKRLLHQQQLQNKQQQANFKWSPANIDSNNSSGESGPEIFVNDNRSFISSQSRRQEISSRAFGDGCHKSSSNSIIPIQSNASVRSAQEYNIDNNNGVHLRRQDIETMQRLTISRNVNQNYVNNSITMQYNNNNNGADNRLQSKIDINRKCDRKSNRITSSQNFSQKSCQKGQQVNKGNDQGLIVGYKFGDEQVPYKTLLKGCTSLTLKEFKQIIPFRKGAQIFYFKNESKEFGTSYVMEEISDDNEILPLFEGNKIYAVIEQSSQPIKS